MSIHDSPYVCPSCRKRTNECNFDGFDLSSKYLTVIISWTCVFCDNEWQTTYTYSGKNNNE